MSTVKKIRLWPLATILGSVAIPTQAEELYAYGEYLSGECTTCHRLDGSPGEIPAIAGWPEAKFIETLNMYRNGSRDNAVMRSVALSLGTEEMDALARYFASQASRENPQ